MRDTKSQFTRSTLEFWQPYTSQQLTYEDARLIAENITGFFQILLEWNRAESHSTNQKLDPAVAESSNPDKQTKRLQSPSIVRKRSKTA